MAKKHIYINALKRMIANQFTLPYSTLYGFNQKQQDELFNYLVDCELIKENKLKIVKVYKSGNKKDLKFGDCFACKYEYNASGLHKGEPCNECFYDKNRPRFVRRDRG
jgi:hypothetical protein